MWNKSRLVLFIIIAAAMAGVAAPARATRVDVTTPGNLLALLPVSDLAASSVSGVAFGLPSVVNNLVGTSSQDDGLVFLNTDTDQRLAITGFNSALTDIRFFTSPGDTVRFPSEITIYYSILSTTSIVAGDSNYTGANGNLLLPTFSLTPGLFTMVPGATNGYVDLSVNAPAGTQTLLFDFGSANGGGDRVGEIQAFNTPEPGSLLLFPGMIGSLILLRRLRGVTAACAEG